MSASRCDFRGCELEARWEVVSTSGADEQSELLCQSHHLDACAVFRLFGIRFVDRLL